MKGWYPILELSIKVMSNFLKVSSPVNTSFLLINGFGVEDSSLFKLLLFVFIISNLLSFLLFIFLFCSLFFKNSSPFLISSSNILKFIKYTLRKETKSL